MIPLLAVPLMAATTLQDELDRWESWLQTLLLVSATVAAALIAYGLAPLWLQLALVIAVFALLVRYGVAAALLLLAVGSVANLWLTPRLQLTALIFLLVAGLCCGALLGRGATWQERLVRALRAELPALVLGIALTVIFYFLV